MNWSGFLKGLCAWDKGWGLAEAFQQPAAALSQILPAALFPALQCFQADAEQRCKLVLRKPVTSPNALYVRHIRSKNTGRLSLTPQNDTAFTHTFRQFAEQFVFHRHDTLFGEVTVMGITFPN